MQLLKALQRSVEELHAVDTQLDVAAYLVAADVWRQIPGARAGLPEQLFVRTEADVVELALYVDPAVLGHLEADNPYVRLHQGNLENYCIALEGISHFVLVAWRASVGAQVSALELEIQAEVDKFVAAWLLLVQQGGPRNVSAAVLVRVLFGHYALREAVAQEEMGRYLLASRVALAYCEQLLRRYRDDGDMVRVKADVRRFFRTGLAEKMRAARV